MNVQRWEQRRHRFRPAGERINPSEYDVAAIGDDSTAKRFVLEHHYSGTYPAARSRFGLYRRGRLVGVSVFSVPVNARSLAMFPGDWRESVELGRFVLRDEVPGNGETWFLARCFEQLRGAGMVGVLSMSDPVPRTDIHGEIIFPGHLGVIYQAHNAVYRGRARGGLLSLLPDGRVFSRRAQQKIRALERGWRYAVGQLEAFGASPLSTDDPGEARAWLRHWLAKLTRPLRHPGNHRYAWLLPRRLRGSLSGEPYPRKAA